MLAAIAAVLALTAVVPIRTSDLASHPRPTTDYESAKAAIGRRQGVDARLAVAAGRTIFLDHGRRTATAVLLLHGYTNSPQQFDSLGQILYRAGDNVYIPRLPDHADVVGSSRALAKLKAEDLRAAADSAMDVMAGLGDTIVVVGLSLGGTMAAWIAQYRPGVRRVLMVAPLMGLAHVPDALETPLMDLALRLPNVRSAGGTDVREPDRDLGWSSRTVGQILRLGFAVQRAAMRTAPANHDMTFLLNGHDHTISVGPVLEVGRRWREHGATVRAYGLSAELKLPHDVIDPRQPVHRLDVVYPMITALARGDSLLLTSDTNVVDIRIERR